MTLASGEKALQSLLILVGSGGVEHAPESHAKGGFLGLGEGWPACFRWRL